MTERVPMESLRVQRHPRNLTSATGVGVGVVGLHPDLLKQTLRRQGRNAHEIGQLLVPGGAWTAFGRLAQAGFISRTGVAHFQVIRADLP